MNRELEEALEQWDGDSFTRAQWDEMTKSPVFKAAIRLERLKITNNIESTASDIHAQVSDRILFGLRGGLRALSNLEALSKDRPKPPDPLPAPWSYTANATPTK